MTDRTRCPCGWQKPAIAIARPDGAPVEGEVLVRLVCPVCETPYTAGELEAQEVATHVRAAVEAGIDPAERELALVVAHITAVANAVAGIPFAGGPEQAERLHMLAVALEHKAHRGNLSRPQVVGAIVDALRQTGRGSPKA